MQFMKKILLSLIISLTGMFVANAGIVIEGKADTIAVERVDTVIAVDSVIVADSIPVKNDTLPMSVVAPFLEWNKNYAVKPRVKPDYMFVPLIFEQYVSVRKDNTEADNTSNIALNINDDWLKSSMARREEVRNLRFNAMIDSPDIVKYNEQDLPEPPKSYVITTDPSKQTVTITEKKIDNVTSITGEKVKVRNWIHAFNGSVQFSQAYLSENWYQGGENNLNVLGQFAWNVKLNENVHKNLLFENNVQYKVSVNSAPQDEIRGYSISQDLFQINTKFGYKAIKNWYYSTTLQFKTQLLNNYVSNTNDMKASFLSPADLNVGIGMTYNNTFKENIKFNMSVAPLSMDVKMCREIKKIAPTTFGIDEGKHFSMKYGSNIEAKMVWKICHEVTWTSRLFSFTNYEDIQGDWENTLDFTINKYLSTRFYAHLRYDNSVAKDKSWKYWQFNEILSFGFNYKFSM